jgi:hypothetical protein
VRRNELFGTVPVQRSSVNQPASLLLTNPPADSLWRETWRPADIQSLNYAYQNGTLTLGMEFAAAPSTSAQYRFVLHVVNGQSIKAWTLNAVPSGNSLQATLTSNMNQSVTLQGTLTTQGIRIELPQQVLGIDKQSATILVSGTSHIRQIRVAQTATVALRLQQ